MTISNIALIFLPIAIACVQNVADPPTAHSPVKLSAVNDPQTGRTAFSFEGRQEPPVIRANPGESIDITYRNEMSPKINSKCATGPCMNMTNLHFHGLHVSPNAPQDDVLSMMAMPGGRFNIRSTSRKANRPACTGITRILMARAINRSWTACPARLSLRGSNATSLK